MRKVFAIFLILFVLSCKNEKKAFQNISTANGDFKLYFIPNKEFFSHKDSISDNTIKEGFKIDSNEIVKEIINTWKFPIRLNINNVNLLYYIEISKNNEVCCSKWINDSLNLLAGKHYLAFNNSALFKYKSCFKSIIAYKLVINNLSDARRLVGILLNNKGYLPSHGKNFPYTWEIYSGMIELAYPLEKLPKFKDSKEVDEFLQKEFKNISKVESSSWTIDDYNSNKDAIFEIMAESDISRKLPNHFKRISFWKELTDLEIIVFDLSEEELKSIVNRNYITLKTIEKINY